MNKRLEDTDAEIDFSKMRKVTLPWGVISFIGVVIFTGGTWAWKVSPIFAQAQEQKDLNKIFFGRINENGDLVRKHDAVIPLMQQDIKDIKQETRDINKKIDQILLAVK